MSLSDIGRRTGATSDDDVVHDPFAPVLPRVNLLPARVTQDIALRKVRRWLIAGGLLLVAAFAGIWLLQSNQISTAEANLGQAQTENSLLASKVAALAPVVQMYDQINGQQTLVKTTMAAQPRASAIVSRLASVAKRAKGGAKPVEILGLSAIYAGIPVVGGPLNSCTNPDPFASEITIGCLTFSATASTRAQVSDMLRLMEADPMFVGPYVTSTTLFENTQGSGSTVTFSGSAGLSPDALATPLTDEQLAAIISPPAPAASGTGG